MSGCQLQVKQGPVGCEVSVQIVQGVKCTRAMTLKGSAWLAHDLSVFEHIVKVFGEQRPICELLGNLKREQCKYHGSRDENEMVTLKVVKLTLRR